MRPVFCGNLDYDARQSEVERLFRRYGRVDRVDLKSGFAFVYMENERDAEDAIRALDRIEYGRKGRRLRVEWTKQERSSRRPESSRRSSNLRPSKTLFVINFDPYHTKTRDLERHFDPYGKILNVRIRRNFAFVQFESQEDATRALDATNLSPAVDRLPLPLPTGHDRSHGSASTLPRILSACLPSPISHQHCHPESRCRHTSTSTSVAGGSGAPDHRHSSRCLRNHPTPPSSVTHQQSFVVFFVILTPPS
ncbi:Serine/arginine-rich splicing factor RS40 [Striga hermonthica]|uniref:Serine/arginine-rich splicing factor RS40 n=1 Tax=Striga hermonthica TaxID=68872 RepID=A0A9N7R3E6_STRHE|nr:Serine/arginine-rich splicing factor RS40 [Striga hermonthica]